MKALNLAVQAIIEAVFRLSSEHLSIAAKTIYDTKLPEVILCHKSEINY